MLLIVVIQYESIGDKYKNISIKKYIDITRSNLSDIINNNKSKRQWKILSGNIVTDYKIQRAWEIYLAIVIEFISFKHSKSDNIEMMVVSKTNETIGELFKSFLKRSQEGSEEAKKGSEFIFDSIDILHYNLDKINLDRGGSAIYSP